MDTQEPIDAATVLAAAAARGWRIAVAESCTGGLVAAALTDIPGSSTVMDRGFVTYSNEAKVDMLGVPMALIVAHGAVSAEVAAAMVDGALSRSRGDIAVAITGIAGPGGGSADKPEGLVHFAAARKGDQPRLLRVEFGALGRAAVRAAAVDRALAMLHALARPDA